MAALLLPFAQRNTDGVLVAPEEVLRGLECDCSCPACGRPVQARKGTEKAWHFAHDKASDCGNGYERSVHELAKQLILHQKRVLIPTLNAQAQKLDAFGQLVTEQAPVFEGHSVALDSCKLSCPRDLGGDSVTPDVTGRIKDREILIEITVFHRLMPEKRERLLQTGLACMEIDLSQFQTIQVTRELLTLALLEDSTNRHWIYHPREASAIEKLNTRLEARIQSSIEQKRMQEIQQGEIDTQLAKLSLSAASGAVVSDGKSGVRRCLQWRACFPDHTQIAAAKHMLIQRTGCEESRIEQTISSIKSRGQLARITPELLAKDWAGLLNIPAEEVIKFFTEGGYLASY